jgi:hypothetical protein
MMATKPTPQSIGTMRTIPPALLAIADEVIE